MKVVTPIVDTADKIFTRRNAIEIPTASASILVATARTAGTVVGMLKDVNINCPVVLMNGAMIYDIKNDEIVSKTVISTNGQGHGALSSFLSENKVEVLICGGIGGGAISALNELGIKLFGGVSGDCDSAVESFLKNELNFNPNVRCSHHDYEHGNGAHTCGEHGCGKGGCHHN